MKRYFRSILDFLRVVYHKLFRNQRKFKDSAGYWKDRYKEGGNSGWGSYDKFAEFKAEVINNFLKDHDIKAAIEFGCGDGNQCRYFDLERYIGIDISKTVIDNNRKLYTSDSKREFYLDGEEAGLDFSNVKLSLSLDVLYHLVEDDVFEQYMEKLFAYPYVIIYSSNFDEGQINHVRHRKFSDWVEKNKSEWQLIEYIKNRYPHDPNRPSETSPADFYIFRNRTLN